MSKIEDQIPDAKLWKEGRTASQQKAYEALLKRCADALSNPIAMPVLLEVRRHDQATPEVFARVRVALDAKGWVATFHDDQREGASIRIRPTPEFAEFRGRD